MREIPPRSVPVGPPPDGVSVDHSAIIRAIGPRERDRCLGHGNNLHASRRSGWTFNSDGRTRGDASYCALDDTLVVAGLGEGSVDDVQLTAVYNDVRIRLKILITNTHVIVHPDVGNIEHFVRHRHAAQRLVLIHRGVDARR